MTKENIDLDIKINKVNILKEFKSKRNNVFLVNLPGVKGLSGVYILKKYSYRGFKIKESFLLKRLRDMNFRVPEIYYEGEDYNILEYLKGETLLDIILNLEEQQKDCFDREYNGKIIHDVLKWMNEFYDLSKGLFKKDIILGDINFRNYIVSQKVYGIDLENVRAGCREEDGGRFCAYLLTYNPVFTKWKIELCKVTMELMRNEFNYDGRLIERYLKEELENIKKRRNLDVNIEDFLNNY